MGQLPPVGDSPLYRSAATEGSATNQGRQLYMTFDVVVQLTKIIRQSGNDELQIKFRDALQRLRDGCPSRTRTGTICICHVTLHGTISWET